MGSVAIIRARKRSGRQQRTALFAARSGTRSRKNRHETNFFQARRGVRSGNMGRWAALFAVILLVLPSTTTWAAGPSADSARSRCIDSYPSSARVLDRTLSLSGNQESRVEIPATARSDLLVYGAESGVDVEIEARDAGGGVIATADNPEARSGVQRLSLL